MCDVEVVRLKKSAYSCFRRFVENPLPSAVWLQQLGCFFLRTAGPQTRTPRDVIGDAHRAHHRILLVIF